MKPASCKPDQASGRESPEALVIEPGVLAMVEVEGSTHVLSFVNDSFCRLLGQPAVALLGKTFAEIAPGGASCVPILDRAYQPRGGTNGDAEAPDSSSACWLYATWPAAEPDKMPERVVIHLTKAAHSHQNIVAMNEALLVGALRQHELREEAENKSVQLRTEIAERQTAEDALRESEARLTAVLEHLPVGVSLIDPAGRTVLHNTLMHQFVPDLLPSLDEQRVHRWQAWAPDGSLLASRQWPGARALRGETVIPGIEFRFTDDDGREIWTSIATAPLRNTSGAITGAVVMVQDIDLRKRAVEALQQSEQSVTRILESITDSFYVVDANWRLSAMNAAARRTFADQGLDPSGLIGKDFWREAFPETVGTALEPEYRRVMKERVASEFEYFNPAWQRWYAIRVYPIQEGGITIYFHDVTAVKAASEKLRTSEERFRALVTATSDVVYRMSADWSEMLLLDGRNFLADTGKPSRSWLQAYIHPEDQAKVIAAVSEAIRTKSIFTMEHRVTRADGTCGWTSSRAIPLLDAQGEIVEWFGAASDITERRESEAARQASAERFHFLAESMPQKIFTAKRSGEMDYFNGPWMEYTHLNFAQIRDSGWIQFIHRDEVDEVLRRWNHSIESGDDFEWEHRIRRHDGVFRWHLTRAHAMRDAGGAVLMWSGSSTDIDETRRTMEEVARTGRAKDDFLAALSHELRTPLTPALMTISALREDERLPLEAREQLAMAERNILLEARLIDDLLDITKISHGKLQLRAQSCDAHHLIRFALEIVRDEASLKGVSLVCALNAHRSGLMADPTRFQQVVWNLLRNALKFTPTGGRISVTTRDEKSPEGEDWLRMEVRDTGIGIAPARLEQIFQPFDQGGLTGDHRFGGVGLGLAIARAVVDLHGGRISAHSSGPGHGSTFTVELPGASEPRLHEKDPLSSSVGPWEPTVPAHKSSRAIKPLRLLVVEDHESTLQTLRLLLRRDGHSVVTSSTVAKALATAAADQFDLVISDLGLPDGTGLKLMKELATLYDLQGIALSGYGTEEDITHSRQAGFIDHLVKPISLSDLRRAIAAFSSHKNQSE